MDLAAHVHENQMSVVKSANWQATVLACPMCRANLRLSDNKYSCTRCSRSYDIRDEVPVFKFDSKTLESMTDSDRSQFWDDGWKKRLEDDDLKVWAQASGQELRQLIRNSLKNLKNTLYTVEANPSVVANKIVLDIGCGGGAQGPLFVEYGAKYIGMDFSFAAAHQTQKYLNKMNASGMALNARAEELPIANESIDFVFSHGVLHHSPHTKKTIEEVFRCLKPGGKFAIGLYVTYSPMWLSIRLRGNIKRFVRRGSQATGWYSHTETAWSTGESVNPWTKTYTQKELEKMFSEAGFRNVKFRKSVFDFANWLPILGQRLDRTRIGKSLNAFLDTYLGNMWAISGTKVKDSQEVRE